MSKRPDTTIVIILDELRSGGAEISMMTLAEHLSKQDFNIHVFSSSRSCFDEVPDSIECHKYMSLNIPGVWMVMMFFQLVVYFRRENPDVAISALPYANMITVFSSLFYFEKMAVLVTEHTPPLQNNYITYVQHQSYAFADRVICVSEMIADDIKDKCVWLNEGKVEIIPNGYEIETIQQKGQHTVDNSFLNGKEATVVSVGRMTRIKCYERAIESIRNITKKTDMKVNLIMVGDGPERAALEKRAQECGVADNVCFEGYKNNPFPYINKADLLLVTSDQESFSNVVVEAMACGTPIVTTDCGGPKEILERGKYGLITHKKTSEDLQKAIRYCINNPICEGELLNGVENYRIETVTNQYINLINQIETSI